MRPVERSEILPLGAYEEIREQFRARVIALKQDRRVSLGDHLTLVFENHDTVLLQIQEMLRTERITDERAIAHEITTYSELIASPGELSATLFIEYEDKLERARMLSELVSLRDNLTLRLGRQVAHARFLRQAGEEEDRLPAVCYLRFTASHAAAAVLVDENVAVALVSTASIYRAEQNLSVALRAQLANDLAR